MINFSSTNILFLEKMEILLSIGAFDCEYTQRQNCEISVALEVQNLDKITEDNLEATYNYGQVVKIIEDLILCSEYGQSILKRKKESDWAVVGRTIWQRHFQNNCLDQ